MHTHKMKTILALMLVSTSAFGFEGWLDIPVGSIHSTKPYDNDGVYYDQAQFNPGIGLTFAPYDYGKPAEYMDYRVGLYDNSYDKLSFYAGVNPHTSRYKTVQYGLILGLVSGYGDAMESGSDIIPAVVPQVSFQSKKYRAEFSYMYGKKASAIVFNIGIKL